MRTGTMKRLAMSALTATLIITAAAQEGDRSERRAQIESKKVAYCTERAGLTSEESAAYWALRNEVDELKKEVNKEAPRRKELDPETMSDAELKDAIKKRLEQHIKAEQIEYDHLDKMMSIVGPKKYALLIRAEKEFKREMLRNLGDRQRQRGEREDRGPHPPVRE